MAININLYPPIVSTYAPAFLADPGVCKLYFSISQYNSIENISNAQVTVRSQKTNLSVLDKTNYPCEIMLKEIKTENGKYYVEITKEDISGGAFTLNEYYKVQIRFTGGSADPISLNAPQAIDSWLAANQSEFSEWSSICLIRAIATPSLNVVGWNIVDNQLDWSIANNELIGQLVFNDETETETLKSYRVILEDDTGAVLTDSGNLYSNTFTDINTFTYTFKYNFEIDSWYTYRIKYTTTNLYEGEVYLLFQVIQGSTITTNVELSAKPNPDNGSIDVIIEKPKSAERFSGSLILRRMAENTNIWEDIYTYGPYKNMGQILPQSFSDYTIESGINYTYCIQVVEENGNRGDVIQLGTYIMIILDDIFLTEELNLKIQYNPTINSYKRTLAESRTDTIGSQFSFFRKNGNVNYASFPIGGLIVADDNVGMFKLADYSLMNNEGSIQYDSNALSFIEEREYRKQILEYLQNGKVKLFRSTPEGNILVRLMDVSLSPNTQLGRKIWSFTATAYEVDTCTVDNYKKYGIIVEESGE